MLPFIALSFAACCAVVYAVLTFGPTKKPKDLVDAENKDEN